MNDPVTIWPDVGIVDRLFQQSLADALCHGAMRLAGRHHGIDQHAIVVDGGVAHQIDAAGVAVDLDFHDMGAVGKGHVLARPGVEGIERFAFLSPQRRHLEQADGTVGTGNDEAVSLEADIGFGRLQCFRGKRRSLGDDLVAGAPDRRAAHVGGARTAVTAACRNEVGVALDQADALVRHAEPRGQHLRKRGFVSLADMLRAGDQRHRAVGFEPDIDILVRRPARALDVIGEPQAAQAAARLALPSPLGEARVGGRATGRASSDSAKWPLSTRKPKALVMGIAWGGTMLRRRSSARSMPVCRAASSISRSTMLMVLGEARPARHADRRGVRHDRHDVQCDRGNAIHRPLQVNVLVREHATANADHVGAEIGDAGDPEGQEAALGIECQRGVGLHVAGRVVGQEYRRCGLRSA